MPEKPLVSVVIPTYNRCEDLQRCLESLMMQTYRDFEIIVIDNGSTDETPNLVKKYPLRVIWDLTKNLSHLFNLGWRNAKADIVVYINDDAEAVPEWLENIIRTFNEFKDADAVGGPTIATRKQEMLDLYETSKRSRLLGFFTKIYEVVVMENKFFEIGVLCQIGAYSIGGSLLDSVKSKHSIYVDLLSITNLAVRKTTLQKIGGFDENFLFVHADGDLFVRMKKAGYKLVFNPKAVVWHHVSPFGSTRSAYYLGRDYAYFLVKNIRPKSLAGWLRFTLNVFCFNLYWIYKASQTGSLTTLRGILGFGSGISNFITKSPRLSR